MTSATHPALKLYRAIQVGQKVKVNRNSKYRRGYTGVLVEKHHDGIDGRGLYGVRFGDSNNIHDFQRHELSIVKTRKSR
jgi:hypothetical protein